MVVVTCVERVRSIDGLKDSLERFIYTQFTSDTRLEHSGNTWIDQARLDTSVDGLERTFQHLLASLKRERNRLSGVSLLPGETLARIFMFGDQLTPIRVSAVCHTWRTAAINEPCLWAEIDIDISRGLLPESLLQLYIQRSGIVPLTVHLQLLSPQRTNPLFTGYMAHIIQRAKSISNLSTSSRLPFQTPTLQSLHLVAAAESPIDSPNESVICPSLLHLSLDYNSNPIPSIPAQRLRTLHLARVKVSGPVMLHTIANLHFLEELCLESVITETTFEDAGLDPTSDTITLRSVNLVNLEPIWYHVLLPTLAYSVATNLFIHSRTSDEIILHYHHRRNLPVSAVYIDFADHSLTLNHDTCLTKLYLSLIDPSFPFATLRAFVPTDAVTSLSWTEGRALPAQALGKFSSLNRLSFTFSPRPVGNTEVRLDATINSNLATLCPHLVLLKIHLRKSVISSITYKDGAEDALQSFLESWTDLHERRFPLLWIQDDIRPGRWADLMATFYAFVDNLELGEIDVMENCPKFPDQRRFLPNPPNSIRRAARPFRGFASTFDL
ncbi:hypothetical protein FS842_005566 [Serendipita sp. 407]|nr:hypothetical protein FS842_005566 [Serendipita sp. 407]